MSQSARLSALRNQLAAQGLDGFVVPLTDEHMSEYVGDYAQRLGWLTGFGGSAGSAVVLADKAAIFTDGRYTLQVREQVSGDDYAYIPVPQGSIAGWLGRETVAGQRIGYDPWLHTRQQVADMAAALADREAELVAVTANPIDAVWTDRPAPSPAPGAGDGVPGGDGGQAAPEAGALDAARGGGGARAGRDRGRRLLLLLLGRGRAVPGDGAGGGAEGAERDQVLPAAALPQGASGPRPAGVRGRQARRQEGR